MLSYLELLRDIRDTGVDKGDRTGTGTRSVFGRQLRFDLSKGFPMLTTKKLTFRLIVAELIWFLRGETNVRFLHEHNCHIWDEWADASGDLGPIYGRQWRAWRDKWTGDTDSWRRIDQIAKLVETLRNNPDSRRMVVSAWNVTDLPDMRLEPCHAMFQCYTRELSPAQRAARWMHQNLGIELGIVKQNISDEELGKALDAYGVPRRALDLQMYQRSADVFLGVPFNIASYALLTHILAHAVGMFPGEYVHTFGDVHIYRNHMDQVNEQLTRQPGALPTLEMRYPSDVDLKELRVDYFGLKNYAAKPSIKAEVAV